MQVETTPNRQLALTPRLRSIYRYGLRWYVRLFRARRNNRLTIETIAGTPIIVLPQVFNPKLLRSGAYLAQSLNAAMIPPSSEVLDMGTGSGVGAIFAAQWAQRVVAVDVNPEAVRCARLNVLLHRLDDRVEVRQGNLFAPVAGERFDVVLFNPPFFRGTPRDLLDHAWRSGDVVERFAAALADHLKPNGRAFVLLSSDGETAAFLAAFRDAGFAISVHATRDLINEVMTVYCLARR